MRRLAFIAALLYAGLVIGSALAMLNSPSSPPVDVFGGLDAYMPGASRNGLIGAQCEMHYTSPYEPPDSFYCTRRPDTGAVRFIGVSGYGGKVRLTVMVADLTYGDLVALWGRAIHITRHRRGIELHWAGASAHGASTGQLTMHTRLSRVEFGFEQ